MRRVALRELRAQLGRSLLALLAVALGIGFVTATLSLRTVLADTLASLTTTVWDADVYVLGVPEAGAREAGAENPDVAAEGGGGGAPDGVALPLGPLAGRESVPSSLAETVGALPSVASADPVLLGPLVLVGADGLPTTEGAIPTLGTAWDPRAAALTITEGHAPEVPGQIALETMTLERAGLEVGDATRIVLGGVSPQPVVVVGRAEFDAPLLGVSLVVLDPASARAAYAPGGAAPAIAVRAGAAEAGGAHVSSTAADVRAALAGVPGVEVVTGAEVRADSARLVGRGMGFLATFLLVFALLALVVGGFLIVNTFAMQVRARRRTYALLRAVGASPAQILGMLLLQAFVVGLLGSLLGVGLGVGLVALPDAGLTRLGLPLDGRLVPTAAQFAATLTLGTATTVLSAFLPARRGARTAPVEALREADAPPERAPGGALVLAAGAALSGGAVAVLALRSGSLGALGLAVAALLLAALVGAPWLARLLVPVLAAPAVLLTGPVGRLARANVVRNPRRTGATAGALLLGMALVGGTAVLAESARASTRDLVAGEAHADLWVYSSAGAVDPAVTAELEASGLVERVEPYRFALARLGGINAPDAPDAPDAAGLADTAGTAEVGATLLVGAAPAGSLGTTLTPPVVAGSLDALDAGHVAVQTGSSALGDVAVGDSLTLEGGAGRVEVTVAARVTSPLLAGDVLATAQTLDALAPPQDVANLGLLVTAAGERTPAQLKEEVTPLLARHVVVSASTPDELVATVGGIVDRVVLVLGALLAVSLLTAALGIVNTLALSVLERTREIGLLRAVGLGRGQLVATIVLESVLTAVLGTALGLGLGVLAGAALTRLLAAQGLSTLVVPWGLLGAFVLLAVFVGVLAALAPASRATRMPVLEAVRSD